VDNLKQLVEEQVNAVMLDSKQFKPVLTGYTKAVKSVGLISAGRRNVLFPAGFQIIIDSFFEGGVKLINTFAMEANNVAYTGNMAYKALVFVTVFNASGIILVLHSFHGVTPIASKKARASRT